MIPLKNLITQELEWLTLCDNFIRVFNSLTVESTDCIFGFVSAKKSALAKIGFSQIFYRLPKPNIKHKNFHYSNWSWYENWKKLALNIYFIMNCIIFHLGLLTYFWLKFNYKYKMTLFSYKLKSPIEYSTSNQSKKWFRLIFCFAQFLALDYTNLSFYPQLEFNFEIKTDKFIHIY